MRTMFTVVLAVIAPILATLAMVSDRKYYWLAFALLVLLAFTVQRPPSWWVGSLVFGMLGSAHLLARWWLRAHNSPAGSALDTFGPGYLVMAVLFYVRHRWFRKSHA